MSCSSSCTCETNQGFAKPGAPSLVRHWLTLALSLVLLAGCGDGSPPGTVPVTLNLVMAGQRAEAPSRVERLWASLWQWVTGEREIWAAGVADIASIRVEVSAADISPPQSTTVAVSNPTSGQLITVELDVKAGTNRTITVSALNAAGTVIFSGTATGVNLTAGVPAAVTITLASVGSATPTTLKITVLGSGPRLNDPLPNIRVLRHDPTTGVVLGDMTTDVNGVAHFGDIGIARTSFSFVTTRSDGRKVIVSFLNVGVGDLKINLATNFDSIIPPTQTTARVTITSVPAASTLINLYAGGFVGNGLGSFSVPPILLPNLPVMQLQNDDRVSVLAEARNANGAVVGCSVNQNNQALDLVPVLSGTTTTSLPINTQSPPFLTTTYTSLTGEPVRVGGKEILRKGVIFDIFSNLSGTFSAGPAQFTHCGIQNAEQAEVFFRTNEAANGFEKQVGVILNVTGGFPPNVSFSLSDLAITSPTRNGQTFSWTTSGGALSQADFANLALRWRAGTDYEWEVIADPMVSSITLPSLPGDLVDRIPPSTNVGFTVELGGVNNVAGFADLGSKFFAVGDFDVGVKFAGATEEFNVERRIGLVLINKQGLGAAAGTVVSTVPDGRINCGPTCVATFAGGTTVTLNVTAGNFAGWSFPCSGVGSCTFTVSNVFQEVFASFN